MIQLMFPNAGQELIRRLARHLLAFAFFVVPVEAQQSFQVYNATDLSNALAQAFSDSLNDSGITDTIVLDDNISSTSEFILNANVNILGNAYSIDMNNADRAFFIAGGRVGISNLTIQDGNASGGEGSQGGGGGAGLGGAIFIGSGTYLGGVDPNSDIAPVAALGISAPTVTFSGVSFSNNVAAGGVGGSGLGGGGGGMGGSGAQAGDGSSGGGGGGFGNQASGGAGSGNGGSAGAFVNIFPQSGVQLSGGSGGSGSEGNGGSGGEKGGGGGGGGETDFLYPGTGGGGGLAGGGGHYDNGNFPNGGGNGGFGGGGGSVNGGYGSGGSGGFGGGGGSTITSSGSGGNGGFGGGGGSAFSSGQQGGGGFGAGSAVSIGGTGNDVHGGGGLGAGGALFVMAGANVTIQGGSFGGNQVSAGTSSGGDNGSAYGADLFLGNNVTFNVSSGNSLSVNSLGGAGNLNDPNVAQASNDTNAQGGIIFTGGGTLTMIGTSYYTGSTVIHQGTVALGPGALEQGTSQVIVGQNAGDNATLALGSSSTLNAFSGTNSAVILGQNAGSTGRVTIGSGTGSSGAFIGANAIEGGTGGGVVDFQQNNAAGDSSPSDYPFLSALRGNLQVVQNGPGTTLLQPLAAYGPNTFSGGVVVNAGTLQLGNAAALPSSCDVTVNGGTFDIGSFGGSAGVLTLNGGTFTSLKLDPIVFNPSGNAIGNATMPVSGFYKISAAGGQGGTAMNYDNSTGGTGGNGGFISGTLYLNAGTNIAVLVGNAGTNGTVGAPGPDFIAAPVAGGGGGGGTFVFVGASQSPNLTLLMAAGGGGGGGIVNGLSGGGDPGSGNGGTGGGYYAASAQGGGGGSGILSHGGVGQSSSLSLSSGGYGGATIVISGNEIYGLGGAGEVTQDPHLFGDLYGGSGGFGAGGGGGTGTFGAYTIDIGYNPTYGGGGGGGGYSGGIGGGGGTFGENQQIIDGAAAGGGTSYAITNFSNLQQVQGGNTQSNGYVIVQYISPTLSPTGVVAYSGTIAASLGGSGGLSQVGNGTTTITAASSFTGLTAVNQGTLVPTVAGALGGTTNVTVATGGTLMLEASNSVNSSASLTLNGGAVQIGAALGQNLGDWTLNNTSTVDFGSYAASLSFTSLAINGSLSIWNWNAMADSIGISGSYSGDLSQIVFYSDSGTNEIGTGAIVGGQLEAVPEPLSNAYLGLGIICFLIYLRRAKAS